jgi:hypothetical protein
MASAVAQVVRIPGFDEATMSETTMTHHLDLRRLSCGALAVALLFPGLSGAIEIEGLKDFEALHGRYAPAGDCSKMPRILVDAAGFTFEANGETEQATRIEFAASYGGNFYQGITQWFFPFEGANGWPILMAFNADEKPGTLTIEGEPPLNKLQQALVKGSPYARCK